jgi:hypothetical protein
VLELLELVGNRLYRDRDRDRRSQVEVYAEGRGQCRIAVVGPEGMVSDNLRSGNEICS